jgi:flagellar protein FlbD
VIKLHRLDGNEIIVNADLIETIAAGPETIVSLFWGNRLLIKESVDQVQELVIDYRKKIYTCLPRMVNDSNQPQK